MHFYCQTYDSKKIFTLTSLILFLNCNNGFSLQAASFFTDGLTGTDLIQRELKQLFQLDIDIPVLLCSESIDLAKALTTFEACDYTTPGIYGVSYGYNSTAETVTYKISNGRNVWKKTYSALLSSDADLGKNSRKVLFDNGFTIITSPDNDERNPAVGVEIVKISRNKEFPS